MYTDLKTLCVAEASTLRDAIAQVDQNRLGIVLVVDDRGRLAGTITDGDIRRAMLRRMALEEPVSVLLAAKAGTPYARPVTGSISADPQTWLNLLREHTVLHLPLVDAEGRVVGLVMMEEFVPEQVLPIQAVVMAGGQGRRLTPLTEDLPKPMLPVGDRPLMEIIIQQLREAGITRVHIATHHQPEKISKHFGGGQGFGVELTYVTEERPLGTAGALGLLEAPKETLLVMNGDILTQVNFRAMLAYHQEHQADLTVGVRHYDFKVPYGVIECEGAVVRGVREKPVVEFFVNAGIYLLEPVVHRFLTNGQPLDMTDLIQRLLEAGRSVVSFPIREYWLDIGQHADYAQAQEQIKQWQPSGGPST